MNEDIIENFKMAKSIIGIADSTLKGYDLLLSRFFEDVEKRVEDITVDDVRQFLLKEKQKGNCAETLKTKINIFRSFFKWVKREEIIDKNPMLKIDKPQSSERMPTYLSHEEVEKARAYAEGQDEMMFEILYTTGIRVSELVNLDWGDVDFSNKKITVTGKGNKTRQVPISTRSVMLMKREREKRDDKEDYVVKSQFKQRMSRESIYRHMRNLGERADIETRITPVILRHTFGTHMLEAGVPIDIVQNMMGHAKVDTTRIYAKTQQRNVNSHYRKVFR